jgi:glycosyltransferase involved in cell wall biosynthesis
VKLTIGIDASNIRAGGGITHLQQFLTAMVPDRSVIDRIIVYGGNAFLEKLPEREWLQKSHDPLLERSLVFRVFWQQYMLPSVLNQDGCNVLFSPGGTLPLRLTLPGVTMSQNMLPFENKEMQRFGIGSLMWLKLKILKWTQSRSIRRAQGVIFLTEYAKKHVLNVAGSCCAAIKRIPHGIEERFFQFPRKAKPIEAFTWQLPFKFLYVSIVDVYKHQWQVAKAVWRLRQKGIPVSVDFVGPANPKALALLLQTKEKLDPDENFIFYRGPVHFSELHTAYRDADAFVFASSCENLPNILLEAMASGLPIASSSLGPMPEVLGENGKYFDPEDEISIADSLEQLIKNTSLRDKMGQGAYSNAKKYSWQECADDTLRFIVDVAKAG